MGYVRDYPLTLMLLCDKIYNMNESDGERPHLDEPMAIGEIASEVLGEIQANATAATVEEQRLLLKKSLGGFITQAEEDRLDQLNAKLSEKFGDQPDPGP